MGAGTELVMPGVGRARGGWAGAVEGSPLLCPDNASRSARKVIGIQRAASNASMALAGTGRDNKNPCAR